MSTYLIVADRTAWSRGLARKLRAFGGPDAEFVIVVPTDPTLHPDEVKSFMVAQEAAARARTSLQLEGFTVLEALAGPMAPRKALEQEISRGAHAYDGIIVGTARRNPEVQIQPDLEKQLERRYGVPVRVISLDGAVATLHQAV